MSENKELLCIDTSGVEFRREPTGDGWQAHVEGDPTRWSRGDTIDEAVGSLLRHLAFEHHGANWRRKEGDYGTWLATLRSLGVVLKKGRLPRYTKAMTDAQKTEADQLIDSRPEFYERLTEVAAGREGEA